MRTMNRIHRRYQRAPLSAWLAALPDMNCTVSSIAVSTATKAYDLRSNLEAESYPQPEPHLQS